MTLPAHLDSAYAECERLATSHYENFPVASRLLPAAMRPHVAAIYAFARTADDFADEGAAAPGERHRLLDDWQRQLHVAIAGHDGAGEVVPALQALAHTIACHRLPISLFDDLLSAFRQDVDVSRYDTWPALMDYCRRSANPVGRLVLRLAGVDDGRADRASDALCSALQLTNFWQDFSIDWTRGRLYLPEEIWREAGAVLHDLQAGRLTPAWRAALRDATARTRALFDAGRPVCEAVSGRLAWELRATWLGGMAVLDKVEQSGFDVFGTRPVLARRDVPRLVWRTITWRASRGAAPRRDPAGVAR